MKYIKLFVLVITIIIFTKPVYSQFGLQNEIVKIKTYQSFDMVHAGGEFKIAIVTNVKDTWHINSNNPKDKFLIPTTVMIDDTINFNLLKIAYPEAHDIKLGFSDTPLSVWEGKVYIGGLVKAADNLLPGKYPLVISVEYQACNNQSCLAPTIVADTLLIQIAGKKDVINKINQEVFKNIDLSFTQIVSTGNSGSSDDISNILEENGILLGLIFVFGIIDQSTFNSLKLSRDKTSYKIKEIVPFVGRIEKQLAKNSNIYLLPYVSYPHTPVVNKMNSHEHIVPYIYSTNLNWSWPVLSGKGIVLNNNLSKLSSGELIYSLRILGFNGLWVDRYGYHDGGEKLINEIAFFTGENFIQSETGRYVYFNIGRFIKKFSDQELKDYRNKLTKERLYTYVDSIDFDK
ncbi:MAG: hypothetical protein IIA49_06520, partial [Bacteroidetes bacterium]|nr:hypothetical protein [Bacteroidota bacterium]